MKGVIALATVNAVLWLYGIAQANITIETVQVGDVGNLADILRMDIDYTSGYGMVNYKYNIGKYEVTAGQYTDFLNTKAKSDPYGLYNTSMWSDLHGCKIQRSGSSGSYTYSVASDYTNRPVNYVSFWDSCRFANWLGNGQSNGSTETGAYTLTPSGIVNNTIVRNLGWNGWAVTSEDEWYKAAYYKGGGIDAGYWLYPTSSDTVPGRDLTDSSGNNANWLGNGNPYPIKPGKYTTVVGEFQNSDSPYGTFDQGGNVWEWNEAIIEGVFRGLRGSSFGSIGGEYYLRASHRYDDNDTPEWEGYTVGFRLSEVSGSTVPEPSSLITVVFPVLMVGVSKLWRFRK